jgi:hypothetical protein
MADDNPQDSSEDAAKAETIRITLPSKGEPEQKRGTVRINLPGRPAETAGPPATSPKKETTKIVADLAAPSAPSAPSAPKPPGALSAPKPPGPLSAPKPSVPPPSGARPSAPPPPRPLGAGGPPKPPTLGARPAAPAAPTAPLKPAPTAGLAKPAGAAATAPGASPKKETARITLPPEGAKPGGMPKATVKMGQTQPLARQPSTMQASPVIAQAAPVMSPVSEGPDSGTTIMSIAAFVFALAALGLSFWAYSASGAQ